MRSSITLVNSSAHANHNMYIYISCFRNTYVLLGFSLYSAVLLSLNDVPHSTLTQLGGILLERGNSRNVLQNEKPIVPIHAKIK